jgi:hypothetical protein
MLDHGLGHGEPRHSCPWGPLSFIYAQCDRAHNHELVDVLIRTRGERE